MRGIVNVPINKIQLRAEDRFRRDMGDVDALAANIRELGLLQPVGLDEEYNLVYGFRRLQACEQLGWKRIPSMIIKLKSLILAEYSENEFRKQFTPSERAAIGKAIEAELGNRRGKRTDLRPIGRKLNGRRYSSSADIAAHKAGFGGRKTYERALKVADNASPELIAAMDTGRVSIDAAAKIACQPKAEQVRILEMPKEEQREVVRQIRKTKADREAKRRARDVRLFRGLYSAVKTIGDFHEDPGETWDGLWRVSAYDFADHLSRAIEYLDRLRRARPNETRRPIKVS